MLTWLASSGELTSSRTWMRLFDVATEAVERNPSSETWPSLLAELAERKPQGADAWQRVFEAFDSGQPIIGRIATKIHRKGGFLREPMVGYVVDIGVNAFMRHSVKSLCDELRPPKWAE